MEEQKESLWQELPLHQGWHPFYIFPALYVFSSFLVMSLIGQITQPDHEMALYYLWIPVVFGILNMIACVKFCKPQYRIVFLNSAVLVKCALILAFVFVVIIVLMMVFLSIILLPFVIQMAERIIIVCLIISAELVVFGAPYTLAYLTLSVKAGLRSKFVAIIHGLLQFCIVADVVDVMYLAVRERKWIKLCVGFIIGVFVLIFLAVSSTNI